MSSKKQDLGPAYFKYGASGKNRTLINSFGDCCPTIRRHSHGLTTGVEPVPRRFTDDVLPSLN
jgi:hypothetical protein